MATMFGRFEIQSELSKSDTASIYKAMDTETNQVVALKTQSLESLGDRADAFVEMLIAEGETTRDLVGQNIVLLYGAGEIDGQFCAAMEYIQGNSIATMLARKEGFSIWDLLDITRQVCSGLEHAASKGVAHHSLEPAKILVQWDGMVKILGYGISYMSLIEAECGKGLGRLMPYCSPEQIRGEAIDPRSNVFTLGTILYEMVVGRQAFDAADPVTLLNRIENEMPAIPLSVNPKIHPAVSALIMKALAKDPAERYQSARELVEDLEKCKESASGKKGTPEARKTVVAPKVAVDSAARAAAASKFVSAGAAKPTPVAAVPARAAVPKPQPMTKEVPIQSAANGVTTEDLRGRGLTDGPEQRTSKQVVSEFEVPKFDAPESAASTWSSSAPASENRAAAAAAGAGSGGNASRFSDVGSGSGSNDGFDAGFGTSFDSKSDSGMDSSPEPHFDSGSGGELINDFEVSAHSSAPAPSSSAAVEQEQEAQHDLPQTLPRTSPRTSVTPMRSNPIKSDPMMAEPAAGSAGTSFSDMAEMPPLKEPVYTPPVLEPVEQTRPTVQVYPRNNAHVEDKPRIQPREVAEKAIKEISTIPPRLMLFSILGAVGLILIVVMWLFFHVRSEDDGSTAAPHPTKSAKLAQSDSEMSSSAPSPKPASPVAQVLDAQPSLTVRQVEKRSNSRRAAPAPAPVVVPGQALIDSNPQGAQFQVDGKSDPSWVTPFTLATLLPGKHIVAVSKAGYSAEVRSVDVTSGAKASLTLHLTAINALMVVSSTPAGAEVVLDGKPTGRITPVQFAVEKGSHTVLLRKQGFLDETVTADLGPAQNFQYSPALRALGNVEDIKTVGKLNKLFGRGGDSVAGMGSISIHSQPKGAQIAINQRLLDKLSPVEVMLGPGNYVVDITLTGFKPVRKVVSVDKGNKVAIDEILVRE